MKKVIMLTFLLTPLLGTSQTEIAWDGNYQLQLSDFKSPTSEIGNTDIYSLHTAASIDFSFAMSSAEFMFTKNFNNKVNCTFKCNAASLIAPDSSIAKNLLHFARYEFDLSELYARKLRQKLFENKGAFSNINFFKPLYDEIYREFSSRDVLAGKQTDLGRNSEALTELHQLVQKEIEAHPEFCKSCKPTKKKK